MTKKRILVFTLLALIGRAVQGQVSNWTTAAHLSTPLNSAYTETKPSISKDGLSLYFACDGCGGISGNRIYVSHRDSMNDPWKAPESVGDAINNDTAFGPFISPDGQRLYFASTRNVAGSRGGTDLWVSHWDGSAWGTPENLGDGVNSSANEDGPTMFDDSITGKTTIYFFSNRRGVNDIYTSTVEDDGTFGPAILVSQLSSPTKYELSNPWYDNAVGVRQDGLEMFFTSNRPGSMLNMQLQPSYDIWTSTRASTSDSWSMPVNVDPQGTLKINSRRHDGGPALSYDGMNLYFQAAQRAENIGSACPTFGATCYFDLWVTTRPDTTPPHPPTAHVTPAPNAAGWNSTDVVVSFTSNGDAGPIASGVSGCAADVSLSDETSSTEVSGTCTDVAGNVSEPTKSEIKLDKIAPAVSVTGVSNGASYLLGSVPTAGCSTSDTISGVATSASLSVTGGTANGVGAFTATCSGASDLAGNVAAPASVTYTVAYEFSGFLAPLGSGLREFTLGRTIPVKWQLRNGSGEFLGILSSVQSLQIAYSGDCSDTIFGAPFDPGTSAATGLRFDIASNQFVLNWQTQGLLSGCYKLLLTLDDLSVHSTAVKLN